MMEGCSSLATENRARTSFSPSPTCSQTDASSAQSLHTNTEHLSQDAHTHVFGGKAGGADAEEGGVGLSCHSFGLQTTIQE